MFLFRGDVLLSCALVVLGCFFFLSDDRQSTQQLRRLTPPDEFLDRLSRDVEAEEARFQDMMGLRTRVRELSQELIRSMKSAGLPSASTSVFGDVLRSSKYNQSSAIIHPSDIISHWTSADFQFAFSLGSDSFGDGTKTHSTHQITLNYNYPIMLDFIEKFIPLLSYFESVSIVPIEDSETCEGKITTATIAARSHAYCFRRVRRTAAYFYITFHADPDDCESQPTTNTERRVREMCDKFYPYCSYKPNTAHCAARRQGATELEVDTAISNIPMILFHDFNTRRVKADNPAIPLILESVMRKINRTDTPFFQCMLQDFVLCSFQQDDCVTRTEAESMAVLRRMLFRLVAARNLLALNVQFCTKPQK